MTDLQGRAQLLDRAADYLALHNHDANYELLRPLPREELLADPDLCKCLAIAMMARSEYKAGLELLIAARLHLKNSHSEPIYYRLLHVEGCVLTELGRYVEGQLCFEAVLERASTAEDLRMMALATMNLGAIACIRLEFRDAFIALQRALPALHSVGDSYTLAGCHQNLGIAFRDFRRYSQALQHFDLANELFSRPDLERHRFARAALDCERALLMARMHDLDGAVRLTERALERVLTRNNPRQHGEAQRVLGLLYTAQGRLLHALPLLSQARQNARAVGVVLLEAEACEELSQTLFLQHRHNEALSYFSDAVSLYTSLGAFRRIARMRERMPMLAARKKG